MAPQAADPTFQVTQFGEARIRQSCCRPEYNNYRANVLK